MKLYGVLLRVISTNEYEPPHRMGVKDHSYQAIDILLPFVQVTEKSLIKEMAIDCIEKFFHYRIKE